MIIFSFIFILFLTQFTLVILFTLRSKSDPINQDLKPGGISIIIPFHNEELRIQKLLSSLNKQQSFTDQFELIFVNDYSTDKTSQLITSTLSVPFRIIQSDSKRGKKFAIHQGVLNAQSDFILTLDADVELENYYTHHLLDVPASDLVILPVQMHGTNFFDWLAAIEFQWLQLLTFGSRNPILCNGANLLFRKSAYLSAFASRTDFDLASGDDAFLLQHFLKEGRKIDRVNTSFLTVKTEAPHSISDLLKQRKRWIGKFNRMADKKNTAMLFFLILIQVAFIASLILSFYNIIFTIPLALKFISETIILYDKKFTETPAFFLANIVHHFWYPVYLLLLLFPAGRETRWKGVEDDTN